MPRSRLFYRQGETRYGSVMYESMHLDQVIGYLSDGTAVERGEREGEVRLHSHNKTTRIEQTGGRSAESWLADQRNSARDVWKVPQSAFLPTTIVATQVISSHESPGTAIPRKIETLFPQLNGSVHMEWNHQQDLWEIIVPVGFRDLTKQVVEMMRDELLLDFADIRIVESGGLQAKRNDTTQEIERRLSATLDAIGVNVFDVLTGTSRPILRVQECTMERVQEALKQSADMSGMEIQALQSEAWALMQAMNTHRYLCDSLALADGDLEVTPVHHGKGRNTFKISMRSKRVDERSIREALNAKNFLDEYEIVLAA